MSSDDLSFLLIGSGAGFLPVLCLEFSLPSKPKSKDVLLWSLYEAKAIGVLVLIAGVLSIQNSGDFRDLYRRGSRLCAQFYSRSFYSFKHPDPCMDCSNIAAIIFIIHGTLDG